MGDEVPPKDPAVIQTSDQYDVIRDDSRSRDYSSQTKLIGMLNQLEGDITGKEVESEVAGVSETLKNQNHCQNARQSQEGLEYKQRGTNVQNEKEIQQEKVDSTNKNQESDEVGQDNQKQQQEQLLTIDIPGKNANHMDDNPKNGKSKVVFQSPVQSNDRINVGKQNTFPQVSNNFEKFVPNSQKAKQKVKMDAQKSNAAQNSQNRPETNTNSDSNTNQVTKPAVIPEPAPFTVVQRLAARLRANQAKNKKHIELNNPIMTTRQGLPAVIFHKDDFMIKLADSCKYTLVGKFSNTMPKVELIRKSFILQTQLSGGVKIAHFNARHVYIDLDNELDYITVWTKQRMSIEGQLMRIQTWTPTFRPEEETPIVPIWVTQPELPWHCYKKEVVSALLAPIGKVLYLDTASIQKTRGSLAKVIVQVDLTKDRPTHIWMGIDQDDVNIGRWQVIQYENVPGYCTYCKHQGYMLHECTIRIRDEDQKKRKEMEAERKGKGKNERDNQKGNDNKGHEKHKEAGTSDPNTKQIQNKNEGARDQEHKWQIQKRKQTRVQQTNAKENGPTTTISPQQKEDGIQQNKDMQTGMHTTIPIQNNYIDLELQEQSSQQEEQASQVVRNKETNQDKVPIGTGLNSKDLLPMGPSSTTFGNAIKEQTNENMDKSQTAK